MRKTLLLGLIAGLFLVAMLNGVSAYNSYYYQYSPYASYNYDPYYGSSFYLSIGEHDYYDHFYNPRPYSRSYGSYYSGYGYYPGYGGYYRQRCYDCDWDWDCDWCGCDDDLEDWELEMAIWDVAHPYEEWRENTRGKTSEEVYYTGYEEESVPNTNFRNRVNYDVRDLGKNNNYYKPEYDSDLGYWNWRY